MKYQEGIIIFGEKAFTGRMESGGLKLTIRFFPLISPSRSQIFLKINVIIEMETAQKRREKEPPILSKKIAFCEEVLVYQTLPAL